jgi:hypothetical protein
VDLAEELSRRAAVAVENAQLYEAEQQARQTAEQAAARTALANALPAAVASRLQARPKNAPVGPEQLTLEVVRWTSDTGPQVQVQIRFYSRFGETYQIQQSTDLLAWTDAGSAIAGNNGPVLRHFDLPGPRAFYRIAWSAPA